MTYATTFSGIGGWELGLNACGWELRWQCECEHFCRVLLNERFGVPIYEDIRTICEHNPPPVDVLVGSPPCQPFSVAGKKGGTADARHLYPAFIKLVAQLRPRYVLMEQVPNVLGIDGGRAFGAYIGGLAALGFDCVWHCIPACAVGANHQRDRLWIIAYAASRWIRRGSAQREPGQPAQLREDVSDAMPSGQRWLARASQAETSAPWGRGEDAGRQTLPDASSAGREELNTPGLAARPGHSAGSFVAGGQNWAIEPDVDRVAYGIPARVDRLKGLGNAVVPQIPHLIGQAINEIEQNL